MNRDRALKHPSEATAGMRKRYVIIVASVVPVAALFALLGWAVAQSGGNPGGFGINNKFGEVGIDQRPAPLFAKEGLDGEPISLLGLRGKVVMLDFWSSWCPPCRREAPALNQVYREYRDKNIEFIGVAIWDDHEKVSGHVEEFNVSYPNLVDEKGRIAISYGVSGIPEKLFIDPGGNLVRKFVGPMSPGDLTEALDGLLASQTPSPSGGEGG